MTLLGPIEDFIQDVKDSATGDAVCNILGNYIQSKLGFDFFAVQILQGKNCAPRRRTLTNYPTEWSERYIARQYVIHDMVTAHAARSITPFVWTEAGNINDFTHDQQQIFSEAKEFGLVSGGAVPLHGPGSFSAQLSVASNMNSTEFSKLFAFNQHELQLVATYAYKKLYDLCAFDIQPIVHSLTPREREILCWTARGKTAPEISKILNISTQTVKNQIKNASLKLNASNKAQAATTALLNGLIVIA